MTVRIYQIYSTKLLLLLVVLALLCYNDMLQSNQSHNGIMVRAFTSNVYTSIKQHQHQHPMRYHPNMTPLQLHHQQQLILPTTTYTNINTKRYDSLSIQPSIILSNDDDNNSSNNLTTASTNKIDQILSQLTLLFPLFVLLFALIGYISPSILLWMNEGSIITLLLAFIMYTTGLTLTKNDFSMIWSTKSNRYSVIMGVLCQFIIMPSSAYLVGQVMYMTKNHYITNLLVSIFGSSYNTVLNSSGSNNNNPIASALFLGLCFVGCSPGGTASNVVSYIAKANVALSVVLTSCSTFAAVVVTPLLIKLLLRNTIYGSSGTTVVRTANTMKEAMIQISGWSLCTSTAKVILLPILVGMIFKTKLPQITKTLCRFTPFLSVLFVSMICGGVVAQSALSSSLLLFNGSVSTASNLFPIILTSVLLLHMIGFIAGYFIPKIILPKTQPNEIIARTISIEVGMQNSALAVVLARSIPNIHPLACLPGAISATVHSCLGSILAAIWRWQSMKQQQQPSQVEHKNDE